MNQTLNIFLDIYWSLTSLRLVFVTNHSLLIKILLYFILMHFNENIYNFNLLCICFIVILLVYKQQGVCQIKVIFFLV
jgi:hypothetical protein